ncbi:MAG: hypothetical protein ACE37E_05185 [Hyphomicrobiales bacterium]
MQVYKLIAAFPGVFLFALVIAQFGLTLGHLLLAGLVGLATLFLGAWFVDLYIEARLKSQREQLLGQFDQGIDRLKERHGDWAYHEFRRTPEYDEIVEKLGYDPEEHRKLGLDPYAY